MTSSKNLNLVPCSLFPVPCSPFPVPVPRSPFPVPRSPFPAPLLRALIVDDEPLAREGLAADLTAAGIDVIATCSGGQQAIDAIPALRPDVLFLDIEMPEIDGFGVLERLEPEDVPPAVVFVTAYDAHALRAFDAQALDYVLKPVSPGRLREMIARCERRVGEVRAHREALSREASDADAGGEQSAPPLAQLVVRDHRGTTVVPVADIEWIEADGYYVRLHLSTGARRTVLLRERMHLLASRLDDRFFRTHRSAIVRVDLVRSIRAESRYEFAVSLATGVTVPLSRDRKALLEAMLRSGQL